MKREVQKLFVCGVACALMVFGANAFCSSTTVQANGTTAMTITCNNNCASSLYVNLITSQGQGSNTTTVIFGLFSTDSSGNPTAITGSGSVPSSMISGNGQNNLTLNLNTNAAGIDVQYCVADQYYNYTCTPYSGGVLTVTWQTTNLYSNHIVQNQSNTYGPFTVKSTQTTDTSSATAQTNAFGTQFTDPGAQLGTGHNGTVEIDHP